VMKPRNLLYHLKAATLEPHIVHISRVIIHKGVILICGSLIWDKLVEIPILFALFVCAGKFLNTITYTCHVSFSILLLFGVVSYTLGSHYSFVVQ